MMRVRKPVIIFDFNEVFTSLFYKCVIFLTNLELCYNFQSPKNVRAME